RVPLGAHIECADGVSLSPFRMSFRKSNFMGASPAYTGVVAGSSVAVTSIHPAPLSSLVPGSQGAHPTARASKVHVFSVCGTVMLKDSLMSQVTPRGSRDRRRSLPELPGYRTPTPARPATAPPEPRGVTWL